MNRRKCRSLRSFCYRPFYNLYRVLSTGREFPIGVSGLSRLGIGCLSLGLSLSITLFSKGNSQ